MVPPPLKPNFLDHPAGFDIHIAAASLALLMASYQFLVRPRWMYRSYALILAGVTLRLYLPLGDVRRSPRGHARTERASAWPGKIHAPRKSNVIYLPKT